MAAVVNFEPRFSTQRNLHRQFRQPDGRNTSSSLRCLASKGISFFVELEQFSHGRVTQAGNLEFLPLRPWHFARR